MIQQVNWTSYDENMCMDEAWNQCQVTNLFRFFIFFNENIHDPPRKNQRILSVLMAGANVFRVLELEKLILQGL